MRLRNWPAPRWPWLDVALWWTVSRTGSMEGVLSHETAMALWCGVEPDRHEVHVTVPPGFRRNSMAPEFVVLHRERLRGSDVAEVEGYPVVCREVAERQVRRGESSRVSWLGSGGEEIGEIDVRDDYTGLIEAGMD